jgi:RHS repeat-associated protein
MRYFCLHLKYTINKQMGAFKLDYGDYFYCTKKCSKSNHLGNVLTLFTDKKIPVGTGSTVSYYKADLVSSMDYSPFGATLKGRTLYKGGANATTGLPNIATDGSRYGFNGKENGRETVGAGSGTQDYGMRIYNGSLAKFFSVDPLSGKYLMLTPYQFAGNTPIQAIDLDDTEPFYVTLLYFTDDCKPVFAVSLAEDKPFTTRFQTYYDTNDPTGTPSFTFPYTDIEQKVKSARYTEPDNLTGKGASVSYPNDCNNAQQNQTIVFTVGGIEYHSGPTFTQVGEVVNNAAVTATLSSSRIGTRDFNSDVNVGKISGIVTIQFNAGMVEDNLQILSNGKPVWESGNVKGEKSFTINLDELKLDNPILEFKVNKEYSTDTQWEMKLNSPNDTSPLECE